jgi:penicillin-binding protein 2
VYKHRLKIFIGVVAVLFLGVILRLGYLQIVRGDDYRLQYDQKLRNVESSPARRGKILDRNGYILARDESCYSLYMDYRLMASDEKWGRSQVRAIARELSISREQAADVFRQRATNTWRLVHRATALARAGDLSVDRLTPEQATAAKEDMQSTIARIIWRMKRQATRVGMTVRGQRQAHQIVAGLDEHAYAALSVSKDKDKTVGVSLRPDTRRRYPSRNAACHIIGFTTQVWKDDLDRHNMTKEEGDWFARNEANYRDGDQIGRGGVEMMCEKYLRGSRGFRVSQDSILAKDQPAKDGRDVHLTLDIRLQKDIEALLGTRNGCAVVLEIPNREILAMVSAPTYDLNRYQLDFRELVADKVNLPLLHRAVKKVYPPGSTVKPLSALAALGAGIITPSTEYNCRGYMYDPTRFRCWHRQGGHGRIDLRDSIKRSCNVYYYHVGEKMGVELFSDWLMDFGLSDKPGTGLPDERAGHVPRHGTKGESRLIAIGQGPMDATPLHMVNAIATIAAGGDFRSPIIALEGGPRQVQRQLGIQSQHAEAIREGMHQVVSEYGGSAYKVFKKDRPKSTVCGKTGTATASPHIPDFNNNGRVDPEERASNLVLRGDMAWCVGFAPYENPKYAFAVVIEYVTSGGGGANAGPVARDIIHLLESPKYQYLKP